MSGTTASSGASSPATAAVDLHNILHFVNTINNNLLLLISVHRTQVRLLRFTVILGTLAVFVLFLQFVIYVCHGHSGG